ncbi:MAG: hypothetical protein IT428_31530 [Planctomycetaceae bacterium]|nr:hypothetical protein [Planctomycetaceae bacterium]
MRWIAAFALLCVVGCGGSPAAPAGPVAKVDQKEPDHEEREKVRAWLKENTDSGKWEEVKWWPVKALDENDTSGLDAKKQKHIRLKFRSAVPDGGMKLFDRAWNVEEKTAFTYLEIIENGVIAMFQD